MPDTGTENRRQKGAIVPRNCVPVGPGKPRFSSYNTHIYKRQCHLFEFAPGAFYTYFYNHAHRLRLEKPLFLELPRSSGGYFKPPLGPGGGFTSGTVT